MGLELSPAALLSHKWTQNAEDIDTCPRTYHFQIIQEEMGEPCEHP